jgi:hypothetical protein
MHMHISSMQLHFQVYSTYIFTFGREGSHSLFEWDFAATIMCAANTFINTIESQKQKNNTTHRSSISLVVFIVVTCAVGQTMTGSPQTRSSGQVRKSPRRNKVGQKTGKVRKSTSATRRSLNGKSTGKMENGKSSAVNLDVPIRGMSKSESKRNRQEFATLRIKALVTTNVFRKIKFISNDEMLREAMDWVMKKENVPQASRLNYRVVYESVFNESLNAKRRTCETAGRMIMVDKTMPAFKEQGKELFTIEELCELRRAETEREREAFFWFFGEFLSCVVGKRQWRAQKQYQRISQATMTGSSDKLVTVSDEAFALLMYENYFDKWTAQANAQAGQSVQRERKVIRGKYTVQNSGTCKYGGWNHDGMKRSNYLYALVEEDRKSPQAPAMEKEFLDYCVREGNNTKAGGRRNDEPTAIEGSASMLQPHYIRAAWDLNAEK